MDEYNGLILVRHKEDMITEQFIMFQHLSLQEQQDYVGAVIEKFTRPLKEQMDEMFEEGLNSRNVGYFNEISARFDKEVQDIWLSYF